MFAAIRHRHSYSPLCFLLLLSAAGVAFSQTPAYAARNPEQRTIQAFNEAKKNPLALRNFLQNMPKGADLHMHLSGAIYAETFLSEAVAEGLCIDTVLLKLIPANPELVHMTAPCGPKAVPAADALKDQHLYDELVDAFSMRSFVPTSGISGHDQFFATFDRFGGLKDNSGAWLDEVATRAASQNEQYLEIMTTPPFSKAAALGYKNGWPAGAQFDVTSEQLARLRDRLLAGGLRDEVAEDIKKVDDAKAKRDELELCESHIPPPPSPDSDHGYGAACRVKIHFLYQVLRAFPPQQVFAQTLLGFEVASAEPDFVGINFVQPEDDRRAMDDYHLQMEMLDYLHSVYPKVHIALHAGELAPGLVPPQGLKFHIREAVELGHAERIGHGVDAMYEDHPQALLKELADRHVMVEINLTSNDVILSIKGNQHPLALYRAAHVPVALSTDDEGVSRIDLTHEYERGVEEQGLTYLDLKQMARTSLEHAFLSGESLWPASDDFTHRQPACAAPITPTAKPSPACAALLQKSERAAEQWELERRFVIFEK